VLEAPQMLLRPSKKIWHEQETKQKRAAKNDHGQQQSQGRCEKQTKQKKKHARLTSTYFPKRDELLLRNVLAFPVIKAKAS
jgi:hypothetical protein